MDEKTKRLISTWQNTACWFRAWAEEAFYAGDRMKAEYMSACARQWDRAIKGLIELHAEAMN